MPEPSVLSVQLYSLRMFPPLDRQLAVAKRLGFSNVEPFGAQYEDLGGLARALDYAGLTARSGHFGLDSVEREVDRTIDIAQTLGMSFVVVSYLQPHERPADRPGWEAMGHRLDAAASRFEQAGLRLAYHNHDFEFRRLPDGSMPIELILGDRVAWQADLAWAVKAGVNPIAWLARYRGRVPLVHVKDIAPEGERQDEGGWADPGSGTMDWPALWQASRAAGAELMIAEHDHPSDAARFLRIAASAMADFESREA